MYEWLISYEGEKTLDEIKKIGIIKYEPDFENMNFIIMESYLSKETILKISGVTECRKPAVGSFDKLSISFGGGSMDKSIAQKVIRKEVYYSMGYSPIVSKCPNCKKSVGVVINHDACECGQKLDWNR